MIKFLMYVSHLQTQQNTIKNKSMIDPNGIEWFQQIFGSVDEFELNNAIPTIIQTELDGKIFVTKHASILRWNNLTELFKLELFMKSFNDKIKNKIECLLEQEKDQLIQFEAINLSKNNNNVNCAVFSVRNIAKNSKFNLKKPKIMLESDLEFHQFKIIDHDTLF